MVKHNRSSKMHHIFIISAICFIQINCNATDINGCLTKASKKCSRRRTIGSNDYKSCLENRFNRCLSTMCRDRSVNFCNSEPTCMTNYKDDCINKLRDWYIKKTACESNSLDSCQSRLPDLDEYATCWEQHTQKCANNRKGRHAVIRTTFYHDDCEVITEQERLCFDIHGSQQCTNVSYSVLVCYYS